MNFEIIAGIVAVFLFGIMAMRYGQVFLSDSVSQKDVAIDNGTDDQFNAIKDKGTDKPRHIALVKQMHESYYLTYDDKDLGKVMHEGDVTISGDNIAFVRNLGTDKNPEPHVFFNGTDKGLGAVPLFDGDNFAFIQTGKDAYDAHVIYNGKDLGIVSPGQDIGTGLLLSGGHIVFSRDVSGKARLAEDNKGEGLSIVGGEYHVIYDGIDKGEGMSPVIGENSFAFFHQTGVETYHLIYNGKDMGLSSLDAPCVTDDAIVFTRPSGAKSVNGETRNEIIRNDQKIGDSSSNGGELFCSGKDYSFMDSHDNLIFNGNNLGAADGYGHDIVIADGHIAFTRQVNGKTHVIYDGKDLDEGIYPEVSGNDVAFVREVNGKKHVFMNSHDKGEIKEGTRPVLLDGKLSFYRTVSGETHVIYDGTDMSTCGNECNGYASVAMVSGGRMKAMRLSN